MKIIVGKNENEETFYLHDEQATKFSDVLAAAVKGGFKEAEERTVKLPEDDSELFQIFAGFTYSGAIHSQAPEEKTPDPWQELTRLANLWGLGEKLQAGELKDAAVDATIEVLRACGSYPTALHRNIYPRGTCPSGMRKLCMDIAVWEFDDRNMANLEQGEEWDRFFFGFAVKLKTCLWLVENWGYPLTSMDRLASIMIMGPRRHATGPCSHSPLPAQGGERSVAAGDDAQS